MLVSNFETASRKVTKPPSADQGLPVVTAFREFVGPSEPEIARQLRPTSLRAKFGLDKVRNAMHCTDLKEDGVLEVSCVISKNMFWVNIS
jgi:nucleoside diphosphate kinase